MLKIHIKMNIHYTNIHCTWARMVVNNLHQSYDNPPNVPHIGGVASKHQFKKSENFSAKVVSAATALVKAVHPPSPCPIEAASAQSPGSICSSGYKDEISGATAMSQPVMKFTQEEFMEQKLIILEVLRKL